MPIANCFVHDDVPPELEIDALAALWSQESGVGSEEMTINVIGGTSQAGAPYDLAPAEVQVITSIVEPGHVVESGETQNW